MPHPDTAAENAGPAFVTGAGRARETTGPGVRRQVLAHGPALMLTRVVFETGGVGARHQHPHAQRSDVESGAFAHTSGGETRVLGVGDSCYVPPLARHGVVCTAAEVLVDAFTPPPR